MKRFKLPLTLMMAALMGLMMISCQGESKEAKDEARAALEGEPAAVATAENAIPTPAADAPVGPSTTVDFAETKHDYGVIEQGEKVAHVFKFKNTGNEPLIISNAKGSCGCTVPQWPKDPVMPGAEGVIKVVYNTARRPGAFTKTVTLTSNAATATKVLKIRGTVIKETEEETMPVKKPLLMAPNN